jgi:hypothetical protein
LVASVPAQHKDALAQHPDQSEFRVRSVVPLRHQQLLLPELHRLLHRVQVKLAALELD